MDVPEPPRIVFEQPAPCADGARAESAFRAALSPSNAPGPAWTVTMNVARGARGSGLHASGEITDATGAAVAHRALDRADDTNDCAGLARAIGVWASLVLDAEVQRALVAKPPPAPPPAPTPAPVVSEGWPLPAAQPEKPSPESQLFLAHAPEDRQVEIGAASYAMSGTGTGMMAGASAFVVSEVGAGWFLRPALLMGRTVAQIIPGSDAYATLGTGRFDACKRIPGNYLEQRGIQFDLCAGPEVGIVYIDPSQGNPSPTTLPFLAFGPSLDLRGELGNALSVLVRGVAELNVLPESADGGQVNPSVIIGRVEVGLSWRLR